VRWAIASANRAARLLGDQGEVGGHLGQLDRAGAGDLARLDRGALQGGARLGAAAERELDAALVVVQQDAREAAGRAEPRRERLDQRHAGDGAGEVAAAVGRPGPGAAREGLDGERVVADRQGEPVASSSGASASSRRLVAIATRPWGDRKIKTRNPEGRVCHW
jgi:hypothetical protein